MGKRQLAPRSPVVALPPLASGGLPLHHARVLPKRRKIVLALFLCAAAIFAFTYLSTDEPRYHGKRLSQWIDSNPEGIFLSPDVNRPDVIAVRAIGTNALPLLLRWINDDPSSKSPYRTILHKIRPNDNDLAEERANRALVGFTMLGPLASPAIPELAKLASTSAAGKAASSATRALAYIGPPALPALKELIQSTNVVTRYNAIGALDATIHTFGTNAFPLLIECLDHPDPLVAIRAAEALAAMRAEPAIACAKMTRFFHHPDFYTRSIAVLVAVKYREQARSIVPELVEALSDTNGSVRLFAKMALENAAPEVLTNTPAR